MKKIHLDFCLKGKRDYVQGPDIFDAVVSELNKKFDFHEISNIKYSAYSMLKSNASLLFISNFNKDDFEKINSIITFNLNNEKIFALVIENNKKIICSNPYSEDIVRNKSIIDGKTIIFNNVLNWSLTETIVSMNKYYLQEEITKTGKWIVTKFEYDNLLKINNIRGKTIKLILQNNFNNKLTKSNILIDNEIIGNLYFSLIGA